MNTPESRIEDLEVKLAYLERTVTELDEVLREVADDNRRLKREMTELRERVLRAMGDGTDMDPEIHQVPPHY